jgi:NAD(P)-dependent dehydrogenase (short-subunit alcohol dehydrogenase family)
MSILESIARRVPLMDGDANTRRPVAVVTGGSAGVGRATARALAQRGYDVAVLARGEDGLKGVVRELEAAGAHALGIPTDVADAEAVEAAAQRTERELGPIDVWVNDAMTSVFGRFSKMSAEEFGRVTAVTYLGVVHGTMAALRRMQPRDAGTIVQVGSALAYRSIPLQSAYCGAKHAIVGFTDSLRSELIHDGSNVHLTVVHLPGLNTPQFRWTRSLLPQRSQPVPPIFQPEVAGDAIAWAAEQRRREVFVGRSTWQAILGQRVLPGWLDRYLARVAWDGQMTGEPAVDRPDNLFEPVAGDPGAHGPFDDRALPSAPTFFLDRHRRAIIASLGLAGLMGAALLRR